MRAGRPQLLAHRGDHRAARENTLEAFAAALAVPGCDGIELDVRASADGEAIVLHDATLDRVFGRVGACGSLTAAELAAVGVPTLERVLEVVRPPAIIDVELKEDIAAAAIAAIRAARGDPPTGIFLSSFEPAILEACRSIAARWPRWLNVDDLGPATIGRAARLGCSGVSVRWRALDAARVAEAHDAGLVVAAWTLTSREEAARVAAFGVDALCLGLDAL